MGTYNAKQRKKYATVGDDGYPIGDKTHAELALKFINKGGLSSSEKATVRKEAKSFGVTSKKSPSPTKTTKQKGIQ